MLKEALLVLEHLTTFIAVCSFCYYIFKRYNENKYKKIYDRLIEFRFLHPRISFLIDEVIRREDFTKVDLISKDDVLEYMRDKALSLKDPNNKDLKKGLIILADMMEKNL